MPMSARLIIADLIFACIAMRADGSLHSLARFFDSWQRLARRCGVRSPSATMASARFFECAAWRARAIGSAAHAAARV